MLSILIPVFNYDCSMLVMDLGYQAARLKSRTTEEFDYEIILADDASTDAAAVSANKKAIAAVHGRYIAQPDNMGRARTCNRLAREARMGFLLLMDCDAGVVADDFLARYWADRHLADVVCGALVNPPGRPRVGHELRYRYERAAEGRRPAAVRRQSPYANFTTFNVLFRRDVFTKVCFDERCVEYGYEDALMGLMFERAGISVAHTDNALMHMGIDTSISFLDKTETALRVLHRLGDPMQSHAGASRVCRRLQRYRLARPVAFAFRTLRGLMRANLLGRHPSVRLFQLYKLGYYTNLEVSSGH